jgi:ADP-ribosylation factor GTPase-activating protein 2/3
VGANGKDIARTASPLSRTESSESKPAASRITHSAALRKTGTGVGPRKANVLGAKKTTKLAVKKVTSDIIDFDEAEKKAKEEAERIEKLGYDPDAEEAEATEVAKKKSKAEASNILSPTPISPTRGGFGATSTTTKSSADVERLGMGVARLGFGQVGGPMAAAQKKAGTGGFGSVGPIKASSRGVS